MFTNIFSYFLGCFSLSVYIYICIYINFRARNIAQTFSNFLVLYLTIQNKYFFGLTIVVVFFWCCSFCLVWFCCLLFWCQIYEIFNKNNVTKIYSYWKSLTISNVTFKSSFLHFDLNIKYRVQFICFPHFRKIASIPLTYMSALMPGLNCFFFVLKSRTAKCKLNFHHQYGWLFAVFCISTWILK